MIAEFLLPDLGEGLPEAEIVAWLVAEGDEVALNQTIAEVETAKAVVEIPSPYAGTVQGLHAAAGDVVLVGSPLVSFAVGGPDAEDPASGEGRTDRPAESVAPERAVPAGHSGGEVRTAAGGAAEAAGVDRPAESGSGAPERAVPVGRSGVDVRTTAATATEPERATPNLVGYGAELGRAAAAACPRGGGDDDPRPRHRRARGGSARRRAHGTHRPAAGAAAIHAPGAQARERPRRRPRARRRGPPG